MDGMFVYFNYFLLLTLFASFNLNIIYFNDFCVKFRNATNEAFVTDVIWLTFKQCKLFIHHVIKVAIITTKNCTNMGIAFSSSSLDE
jgi:hypothetical protein